VKASCTVRDGGKPGDNIKGLPIVICCSDGWCNSNRFDTTPDPSIGNLHKEQYGAKYVSPYEPTQSVPYNKDDPKNPAAQYKYGIVFAKPTDSVAFRHTITKNFSGGGKVGWPNIRTSENKDTLSKNENCLMSMIEGEPTTLPNFSPVTKAGLKCNEKKDYKQLSPSNQDYKVKEKVITPSDVGKKFVQMSETDVSWAHTDNFVCIDNDASYGLRSNQACPKYIGEAAAKAAGHCEKWGTTKINDDGFGESKAQINVPYNYQTTIPEITNPTTPNKHDPNCGTNAASDCDTPDWKGEDYVWPNYGTVYAGEHFSFSGRFSIKPRNNPDVDSTKEYATHTKPSAYQIVSFALAPDSAKPQNGGYGTDPAKDSETGLTDILAVTNAVMSNKPCAHYTTGTNQVTGRSCIKLDAKPETYNQPGLIAGKDEIFPKMDTVIDDLPVGTKICVAIAVWPADSHNQEDYDIAGKAGHNISDSDVGSSPKGLGNFSMYTDKTGFWQYGAPYCVTIAKKPNFQVWNGGTYSDSGILTSQSPKLIRDPYFMPNTAIQPITGLDALQLTHALEPRITFGSWSEWEVVAMGVKGYGSGAAFGYEGANNTPEVTYPGGYSGLINDCGYSPLTLGNENCAIGKLGILTSSPNPKVGNNTKLINQIRNRYGKGDKTPATYRNAYNMELNLDLPTTQPAIINGRNAPDGRGKVYVYDARGKADQTLSVNIEYPNGPYDAISQISQVIILADDLNIDPSVTHIDAWIILSDGGTLNTCADPNPDHPDSARYCTNPLTITGPVFAPNIQLNRTYGALPGVQTCYSGYTPAAAPLQSPFNDPALHNSAICDNDQNPVGGQSPTNGWKGSIAPAERFILRADAFLWAYNQGQVNAQAVEVYQYERSPNI